jgi:SSS family solute:Na+ symporter
VSRLVLISTNASNATVGVISLYILLMVFVGYIFRRHSQTSSHFLHARRTLPTAITTIAFLAANCGALEIIGLAAASAKYGVLALHFYWIGAIPAMIFVAIFMMPIYSQSSAYTLPDFLRLRYDDTTQMFVSISLMVMMAFVSGISLYAIASLLRVFLGWSYPTTVCLTLAITGCYVLMGGLKGTIYNEIIQLAITVAGLAPLSYAILHQFHGIRGLIASLPEQMRHAWTILPFAAPKSAPMDQIGVVAGLGFVLSFGYWCTDFVLIQRALAARDIRGSLNTPLFAGFAKLLFPLLVIVPGLAAHSILPPQRSLDETLPTVMLQYYGPMMLGIGVAAILASLMSALAGNIMAIATIWTHDVYRVRIKSKKSEAHYLLVGKAAVVGATALSVISAYVALRYNTIMDYLQLILSLFNAPLLATVLLGMFTTWATPRAATVGLAFGMITAISVNFAAHFGKIRYGSQMGANFYGAILAFTACLMTTALISLFTPPKSITDLDGITYRTRRSNTVRTPKTSLFLALILLMACIALNIMFR